MGKARSHASAERLLIEFELLVEVQRALLLFLFFLVRQIILLEAGFHGLLEHEGLLLVKG